jgi:thiol-disulfide isomerase/thioredoxin
MTSFITRAAVLSAVLALCAVSSVSAQKIGSAAASLDSLTYVKGDKVDISNTDNVYVVEFWATWCPPCRASIPHLTKVQKTFKDKNVVIVGISNETEAKVKPFVDRMGDKMDYVVALDPGRKVSKGYMEAFGVRGIPHAFIVKDAKVAWQGHPMDGLDKALERIIGGKGATTAGGGGGAAGDTVPDAAPQDLEELFGAYMSRVTQTGSALGAREIGEQILEQANDPGALNQFAWTLLTDERIKHRDLDLALKVAESAHLRAGGRNAAIADTYARAQLDHGLEKALKLQRLAVKLNKNGNADMQADLERILRRYEKMADKQKDE